MAKTLRDVYVGVDKTNPERHTGDFYPTPPLATFILAEKMGERMPGIIIEPCAGRGHISAELIRSGRQVVSYDLNTYDDCLVPVHSPVDATTLGMHGHLYGIVTNPPYHKNLPHILSKKFITEYDFVAMFVRLTFLEGKRRKKLFTEHPPSDIIIFSDRVRFATMVDEPVEMKDQIGGMICYIWVVWSKDNLLTKETKTHWVLAEDYYDVWRSNYESCINKPDNPTLGENGVSRKQIQQGILQYFE